MAAKPPPRPGGPRDTRLDSAPRAPLGAPQRARSASSDDLGALAASDANAAALRAAAAELERKGAVLERKEAALRATEVRAIQAEAERDRLSVVAAAPAPRPKSEMPPDSKGTVKLQGKNWKIAIPVAAVLGLAAPVTALVQNFVARERAFEDLTRVVAAYEKRAEERDKADAARDQRLADLTVVVARMSGFLAKTFPMVGLNVTAEPGAQPVELESNQLAPPPRRSQVTVTTKIPAPKPR